MVIYIDIVIITTFVVNLGLIKTIKLLFNEKDSLFKILLYATFATLSIGYYFIPSNFIWNTRHIYGILISLIAFDRKSKLDWILKTIIFYMLNYAFIGLLEIFNIKNIFLLFVILIYIIILFIIEYVLVQRSIRNKKYEIFCKINNIIMKTLVDTGNHCFYQGLPVSFINKKFFSNEFINIGVMLTKTVLHEELIDIYIGPELEYNGNIIDTYYAFVNTYDYDLIINKEVCI